MESWFSPQTAPWLSFLSLFSLLACLSEYARKGIYRSGVMITYRVALGFGIAFLLGAGTAFLVNQPTYVIFSLGLTGVAMTSAMSFGIASIAREYRKTEMRQSIAQDL